MANEILSTTTQLDQKKFLAAKLIQRAYLRMVSQSICDKIQQPKGTGLTANWVRYERMNVPVTPLTQAVTPANSTISLTTVTATLDQWGDVLTLSDVTQLTTEHPLVAEALKLLADNAQRVIDREVQIVWLAGTNVFYGDGTVTARANISGGMKITDQIIHQSRVTLIDTGAPPRGGPKVDHEVDTAEKETTINGVQTYVAVCGPQVMADIQATGTSLGTWAAVAMYANATQLYNSEVGIWLGVRWVESNFVPKFRVLGNNTAAVTSANAFGTDTPVVTDVGTGGTLTHAVTYGFKVTKKDLLRGFEEFISIPHGILTANDANDTHRITFDFSNLSTGFVWNLYFDSVQGGSGSSPADSVLKLVQANIPVGTVVSVTAVQATGSQPPQNPASGLVVHPIYFHGDESCNWTGLQDLQVLTSLDQATSADPLLQRKTIGYKFLAKASIRDQTRILRREVVSTYT